MNGTPDTEGNENWGECQQCGSPVMIDPETGQTQSCGNCESLASPVGGWLGGYLLAVILLCVAALIYFCVRLLV